MESPKEQAATRCARDCARVLSFGGTLQSRGRMSGVIRAVAVGVAGCNDVDCGPRGSDIADKN